MTVAIGFVEDRVEWSGSRTCAPGPGVKCEDGVYRLFGTVIRIAAIDTDSVRVLWDNKRVTVERRANLTWL